MPTARPATLTRIVTTCADALTTSLTKGSGDHGDLSTWCPDLGVGYDRDGSSTTTTTTSVSTTSTTTATAGVSNSASASTFKERDGVMGDVRRGHGHEQEQEQEQEQQILADTTNGTGKTFNDSERGRGHGTERERGWRKFVKYFSPSWFTVTMGTGIISILLNQYPYQARWLYWLSIIVFALNVTLFVFFVFVSLLRGIMWSETWSMATDRPPKQRLFLGCIPTTMSTIVNMMVLVCVPAWGEWVVYTAWGLWMADAALSLICALYLPFILIKRADETPLSAYTALQLFPIIACVVASASAGVVSSVIPRSEQALATLVVGYVLWGLGLPTALFIMVVYFQRLAIHKLPPKEVIVSCFMPLGPLGMGGFAILKLGGVAMRVFPQTETIHPLAGDLAYNLGVFLCLVFWGFTLLWLFLAVASIHHCKHFPFNMGWWGFTFPIGTFALSSSALAQELPSRFFRVIAAITSACVFLLWLLVAGATCRDLITGGKKLFNALPAPKNDVNEEAVETVGDVRDKNA
ncbi:Plasma membrane sulfite pump involved in sulfite metabolism [Exophiala xenobiotica]|nr:Plasma membrane sulfite pump involved in sulfite metabolism [Exophiala xenobiotica]KAK5376255.1 Plasma membrane sulfite pump involved in sulfite metabolism [Exophiala xenobiotica]KAK5396512.1 Plasma membrane sulfite pump involved in sulfite metabolism [Exophiala xenobiotica]KAK5473207.1 Plasma membrane sulfite pump involved in sulfite metabolism [Exophiala xenobiotica]KAK5526912.1 Plasma membrane sulfite pump involved in sulfite metabolism [Exophiala xenobiotica]